MNQEDSLNLNLVFPIAIEFIENAIENGSCLGIPSERLFIYNRKDDCWIRDPRLNAGDYFYVNFKYAVTVFQVVSPTEQEVKDEPKE